MLVVVVEVKSGTKNDDEMQMMIKKKSFTKIQQLIDAAPREKDIDIYIYKTQFPAQIILRNKTFKTLSIVLQGKNHQQQDTIP